MASSTQASSISRGIGGSPSVVVTIAARYRQAIPPNRPHPVPVDIMIDDVD
jgi:hypothetical protein